MTPRSLHNTPGVDRRSTESSRRLTGTCRRAGSSSLEGAFGIREIRVHFTNRMELSQGEGDKLLFDKIRKMLV